MSSNKKMDLTQCYLEEDQFPKLFAPYVERPYGVLFCNPDNRDSYDSNHAVIYRDKISDLKAVLEDITEYYRERGQTPIIYQSMLDDGWFEDIKEELAKAGYRSWSEPQKYMLPLAENMINPNPEIEVRKLDKWDDSLKQVFLEAEEPWEIEVAKTEVGRPDVWFFAAFLHGKPIGVTYGHCTDKVCRGDYILVSKNYRRLGAGRALFCNVVEWTKANGIDNFYLWPDGESPERIYTEGGFRFVELRIAGRAVYEGTEKSGLPTREQAQLLVRESEEIYPGPWGDHCRTAAYCAEAIAKRCPDMDADKAYIVGLLHDIGRRFGHRHLGHVVDGYLYMMQLGYDEAARICLTHSFNTHSLDDYIGKRDTSEEETDIIRSELEKINEFDDYDRLIQLCDSLSGPGVVMNQEDRMNDVKTRYGNYSTLKWDANINLRTYFEQKMGADLYEVIGQPGTKCV